MQESQGPPVLVSDRPASRPLCRGPPVDVRCVCPSHRTPSITEPTAQVDLETLVLRTTQPVHTGSHRFTAVAESTSAAAQGDRRPKHHGARVREARPLGSVYRPASVVEPAPAEGVSGHPLTPFQVRVSSAPGRLEFQGVVGGEEAPAERAWFSSGACRPPVVPEAAGGMYHTENTPEWGPQDARHRSCHTSPSEERHNHRSRSR